MAKYIIALADGVYWSGFGWVNLKAHAERFKNESEAQRVAKSLVTPRDRPPLVQTVKK